MSKSNNVTAESTKLVAKIKKQQTLLTKNIKCINKDLKHLTGVINKLLKQEWIKEFGNFTKLDTSTFNMELNLREGCHTTRWRPVYYIDILERDKDTNEKASKVAKTVQDSVGKSVKIVVSRW